MLRSLTLTALLLWLVGCQTQAARPQPETPPAPAADPLAPLTEKLEATSQNVSDLGQKLLLVQEQVIKLNQKAEALDQRILQQLQALQRIQMLQAAAAQPPQSSTAEGPTPIDQLTALVARLEQLSSQPVSAAPGAADGALPGFRMVSAYTPAGTWVVLKYDEATGLTWSAKGGNWEAVDEEEIPGTSHYQVVLQPAAGDKKGYVAARIDRDSGQTWWLNGNRWEPFQ